MEFFSEYYIISIAIIGIFIVKHVLRSITLSIAKHQAYEACSVLKTPDQTASLLVLNQAIVMHPNHVPSNNPSEDERIDSAKDYTCSTPPDKTGQGLKYRMVQFSPPRCTKWQITKSEADQICNFSARNA